MPFGSSAFSAACAIASIVHVEPAYGQTRTFDLPSQPVHRAIGALGRQAGVQIIAARKVTRDRQGRAVQGTMPVEDALARMLQGSGLVARRTGPQTFTIVPAPAAPRVVQAAQAGPPATPPAERVAERAVEPEPPVAAQAEPEGGGEVVVTARFRNESLQDVPIAITALSGDQLAEKNLNNIQDIARLVPTVDFRDGASNKDRTIFVRGVGTITTSPGVEPSVAVVLDGVVLTRPGQATLDLVDLERVEVLRGPQGTLFGKNASAGVINIVTRRPTADLTGTVRGTVTSDGEWRLQAGVSGPLTDDGRALFSLSGVVGEFDGNQRSLSSGNEVNGYSRRGVRGKLLLEPTDRVTLTAIADFTFTRDDVPNGTFLSTNRVAFPTGAVSANPTLAAILAAGGVVPGPENRTVNTDFDSTVRDRNYGGSLQADVKAGDHVVTSITAYREWKNRQRQDYDATNALTAPGAPGAIVNGDDLGDVFSKQFSQELRLTSPSGGLVDYVLGLYYINATTDETYRRAITRLESGTPRTYVGDAVYGTRLNNYAAFGEGTINFTDRFRAFIGGRLLRDELGFHHSRTSNIPPGGVTGISPNIANRGSTARTDYTARAGLQFDATDDVHLYGTFARGYKGQAYSISFNMQQFSAVPIDPETSRMFELGVKANLLDRRLQANLAAYSTTYDGYQTNYAAEFLGGFVTRLTNAGRVRSRGFEGDVALRPVDGLRLNWAFAYNDAKIVEFICPVGATCVNFNGRPLPFAPKFKTNVDAAYTVPLGGDLDLELQTDYTYKSRTQYQITQTPDTVQPAYGIWNASVALAGGDGWELRAFVRNIADRSYSSFIAYGNIAGVVRFVPRDDKRHFGLTGAVNF